MTRVLVTGANGHVGSNLCRDLVQHGYEVIALVRETSDRRGLDGVDVDLMYGDILDVESLRIAAQGCEGVFHTAAVYATSGATVDEIMRPAVEGVRNMFEAAADVGVKRIVYTSTTGAVGSSTGPQTRDETQWHDDPKTTYFQAKRKAEDIAVEWADKTGIETVTVNPTAIIGPYDYRVTPSMKFIRMLLEGVFSTGPGGLCFVDSRDCGIGHRLAYEKGRAGERYLLVGENFEMRDYGKLFTELTGQKVLHSPLLPRVLLPAMVPLMALTSKLMGATDKMTAQEADEFVGRWAWYDNSKAKKELGWAPRSSRETLDHAIRWLFHIDAVNASATKKFASRFPPVEW